MRFKSLMLSLLVLLTLTYACKPNKNNFPNDNISQSEVTENLVNANKAALAAEDLQIEKLITQNDWIMKKSPTGLRYSITTEGKGAFAQVGQIVRINYKVKLINGEQIYSSDVLGAKEFRLGSGGVESGLEEGILLLREGSKAFFIIPSYLAHGLAGDQDKIPAKSTILYNVELLELK